MRLNAHPRLWATRDHTRRLHRPARLCLPRAQTMDTRLDTSGKGIVVDATVGGHRLGRVELTTRRMTRR